MIYTREVTTFSCISPSCRCAVAPAGLSDVVFEPVGEPLNIHLHGAAREEKGEDVAAGGTEFEQITRFVANILDRSKRQSLLHAESVLLPPVVAKVDGIDVIFKRLFHLCEVVVGNRRHQFMNKLRILDHIDHQVFHAAQCPCAFIERETEFEDAEAVGIFRQLQLAVFKKPQIERVGKFKSLHSRLGDQAVFHHTDVLVDAAIPDNTKYILEPVIADILKNPNVATDTNDVVADCFFQIVATQIFLQSLFRLLRELLGPRNIRRLFPV